jgi:2-polyprenyl-6-methoxyphenol hydroxylase-like FAD-dependent oxidoreductase
MSSHDVEVAIAGAGPVGLVLAVALARAGVEVAVFEAGADLPRESEASTIHASTLEVLDWLGVAEDFVRTGQIVDRVQYRDKQRAVLAELPFSLLEGRTRFCFRLHAEQWRLTPLLLDAVRDAVSFQTVASE